jgi:hypothetical protein
MSRFRLSQDLAARPHASFEIRDCKNHTKAVLDRMELASFLFQAQQKTAKTLGLMIPPGVLAIADEVIE